MKRNGRTLKWIICLAALPLLAAAISFLVYVHARNVTIQRANETLHDYGVSQLELVSVAPSKTNIVRITWKITFESTHEFMPGDIVFWTMKPFDQVEFTK